MFPRGEGYTDQRTVPIADCAHQREELAARGGKAQRRAAELTLLIQRFNLEWKTRSLRVFTQAA